MPQHNKDLAGFASQRLFDGSLAGLRLTDKATLSVQYHPEASPGPPDSYYLFEQSVGQLRSAT